MAKIDADPVSLPAAADLTTKYACFGKTSATGVNVCSVLGERSIGTIGSHYKKTPVAGDAVDVYAEKKRVKVRAGAAFAIDAELTPDATGRGITAVATNIVRARALQAATAADQLVFFPMPSPSELENEHNDWWRSAF